MDATLVARGAVVGAMAGALSAGVSIRSVDVALLSWVAGPSGVAPVVVVGELDRERIAERAARLGWESAVRVTEPAERWSARGWAPRRAWGGDEVALRLPDAVAVWTDAEVDRLGPDQMRGASVVVAATRAEGVRVSVEEANRREGAALWRAPTGMHVGAATMAGAVAGVRPWGAAALAVALFLAGAAAGVALSAAAMGLAVVLALGVTAWARLRRRAEVAEDAAAAALVGLGGAAAAEGEGWEAVAAQGRLRQAELQRLRKSVDALDMPLAVADEQGTIVHITPALRRVLDARGVGAPVSVDELRAVLHGLIHAQVVERLLSSTASDAGGHLLWVAEVTAIQVRSQAGADRPEPGGRSSDGGNREPLAF